MASAAAPGDTQTEEDADQLAVRLTRAAGYDLSGAEAFLAGVSGDGPPVSGPATHPAVGRRLMLLRAEIAAGAP